MPVLLTKGLSIKVTDEDYASFEAAAGDQRVSAWAPGCTCFRRLPPSRPR